MGRVAERPPVPYASKDWAGKDEMAVGTNREWVRRRNLSTVLGLVHRAGSLSRAAMTTATGLNRTTIAALVADLEARGLVREGDAVNTGTPGRPSPVVEPVDDQIGVVAVDVQVSSLAVASGGIGGTLRHQVRVDLPPTEHPVEQTVDQVERLIGEVTEHLPGTRFIGAGVSVAGTVRREDGFVHLAPNIGWRDVPFGEMLAERLGGAIPVSVGNEADLGGMAEHLRGAGSGVDDLIYVSGEVGVGGGLISGGRPVTGVDGYAGEIGHMVINPDGAPCHCGSTGCWETEIGLTSLLRRMGWHDRDDPDAVHAILREANAGGPRARAALSETGRWLGIGVASLINVLDPQRVVLGGYFSHAFTHLFDAVQDEVDRRTLATERTPVGILAATLGEESSLIGAVELALAPLLADPSMIDIPDKSPQRASN